MKQLVHMKEKRKENKFMMVITLIVACIAYLVGMRTPKYIALSPLGWQHSSLMIADTNYPIILQHVIQIQYEGNKKRVLDKKQSDMIYQVPRLPAVDTS